MNRWEKIALGYLAVGLVLGLVKQTTASPALSAAAGGANFLSNVFFWPLTLLSGL